MSGVNRVTLIGNLGQDPDTRHTPGGQTVCNFTIATNESWVDKTGQKQERVEWHRIVVWGKQADACGKYLSKGRQVYIEGKLQTRKWDDREGVTRYTTEIVAQSVIFLGGGDGARSGDGPRNGGARDGGGRDEAPPAYDDDIPF